MISEPHLKAVSLPVLKSLEKPNRRIDAVYFPDSGFASVVATRANDRQVEVGLIGLEGMTGLPIILGNHRSPNATYIQAKGEGRSIPSIQLRTAVLASRSLQTSLLKYVQAFGVQASQSALSFADSKLHQRLARWILMAHDRLGVDELPLTHEFLSLMLGVRRAGVTEAVHALKREGLIDHVRGQVIIKNRKGLERRAGDSYGIAESEYRRLMGVDGAIAIN
jgi:CRP-like cAMP-binding protein